MRDALQRIQKRKMKESLNKQFMKTHRELVTEKIKEAQVKKSRVKEGLSFKKKQIDLMIKKDLAYTEKIFLFNLLLKDCLLLKKLVFFLKERVFWIGKKVRL